MRASWLSYCVATISSRSITESTAWHIERAGTQLSDHHQGCHAGHESAQGVVSRLGHCVCRPRRSPFGMAGQDQRSRRPATRRTLLPAAGCLTSAAPASTTGSVAGEQETPGMETAWPDSWDRPDPGGPVDRADPDPAPGPHQTATVDLLWSGVRNA